MTQHMRAQPTRPSRQPSGGGHAQTFAQRVIAHPPAALKVRVVPFAGQHRSVGIRPVTAEAVADLGQPPVDQPVRSVDRRNQTPFQAPSPTSLAVADVQLAEPAESGRQSRTSSITVSFIRNPSRRHSDAAK